MLMLLSIHVGAFHPRARRVQAYTSKTIVRLVQEQPRKRGESQGNPFECSFAGVRLSTSVGTMWQSVVKARLTSCDRGPSFVLVDDDRSTLVALTRFPRALHTCYSSTWLIIFPGDDTVRCSTR